MPSFDEAPNEDHRDYRPSSAGTAVDRIWPHPSPNTAGSAVPYQQEQPFVYAGSSLDPERTGNMHRDTLKLLLREELSTIVDSTGKALVQLDAIKSETDRLSGAVSKLQAKLHSLDQKTSVRDATFTANMSWMKMGIGALLGAVVGVALTLLLL